ncbi:hypothetical protein [Leadbetterella sp. DM7]|uniref:hypothetical protein n=1 Tax=Leadbetterella sp. DM7 TaxID=3235085 RepID=UPI00349EB67C
MKHFFSFMTFFFLSLNLLAQYGGTASVRIENSDGEEEYINVVHDIPNTLGIRGESRSKVEESLEREIKSKVGYSGKMKSSISFNVFEVGERSGRASVKVINKDGKTQYINVSEAGRPFGKNRNDLAKTLFDNIKYEMECGERFYGSIQYTLN